MLTVLDRGILNGPFGPEVSELEREWAAYCGVTHCLATNSGTAALHCALAGAGVQPGDEVIVPAFSFIATAYAAAHQGATPVFCDIDPGTYNADPAGIESVITSRTAAIVPAHLHGLPADMDEIMAIADRHGLVVIEDAAQAHGATYKGRRVGALGHAAGFSLNAAKNLVGGEGGLLVTDDNATYTAGRRLAMFGEDAVPLAPGEFPSFVSEGLGWNYRCTEIPAALARSQVRRIHESIRRAEVNARILSSGLAEIDGILPPSVPEDRTCVWHKYRVRLDLDALGWGSRPPTELRDRVIRALQAEGAEPSVWHTSPLPANPAFRRPALRTAPREPLREPLRPWDPSEYPNAARALDETFLLGSERAPMHVQGPELIELYVEAVGKVLGNVDRLLDVALEPISVR